MGIFAWNYTNFKGIPLRIVQHCIEFDTTIPPIHQTRYQMNPNYLVVIKQYLDKLLSACFISLVEEANWSSPIVVISKKMANFIFAWILDNSMLQPRKIHTLYLLSKNFWMK